MTAHLDDPGTLVELFARTVRSHPNRPAVSDDHDRLTYAQLDRRSDGIARALLARGLRKEDRVAVYLGRGVDVFVAILAVLKAGGAYVAIDSRYPDARREAMIHDSGAAIVISGAGWREKLGVKEVAVLDVQKDSAPQAGSWPGAPPAAGDLACVLFTSGSSGTPKAIMLEHRNLIYLACNPTLVQLEPSDRFGQVSSLSFDAFHIETWCSFARGAEVAVLPTMAELVAYDLKRELRRRRITAMLVPTMAVNHVVHEDRDAFASLRIIYTGGEVLQPGAARALRSAGQFFNLYGPTEISTACTAYRIAQLGEDADSVPIGTDFDGAAVHVLDWAWNEVPQGKVGEMHVGGRGVARGYLGQPALTASHFLPDPFGSRGSRMYATGDLARRGADRQLDFCGRVDDQVKIRGYRVEPREVERTLLRHPGVRDAAVVVVGETNRSLVAMVVPHKQLTARELRAHAAGVLPDYMVPSLFLIVPEVPGNDHGKRELSGLRQVAAMHLGRESRRLEPQDELDSYLAGMWEQLLGIEWIASSDDFFALGGNSMLAFRAHMRIERDLGVRVEVAEIFELSQLDRITSLVRERTLAGPNRAPRGIPARSGADRR